MSIHFPHYVKHETKEVYVYVESGFPTSMIVSKLVKKEYPDYSSHLCSKETITRLLNS